MKVDNNAAQTVGAIIVALGILAFIVIIVSFDWAYYGDVIIVGIVILASSITFGVLMVTLGRILAVLEIIAKRDNQANEQDGGSNDGKETIL